ncbi:MAG: CBS domain-containing protein, partial [Candidatus Kariarchaeaceae archaeon]
MKLEEIMIRSVKTVRTDDTIKNVAIIICTNHISGVPVVDDKGEVVGIISEKDIIKAMYPDYTEFHDDPVRSRNFEEIEERYEALLVRKVEDLMSRNVLSITPDAPILKAASLMILKKIRRLPIIDQ